MKPKVVDSSAVAGVQVYPNAPGRVLKRDLVGKLDSAPNFAMRLFEVGPGGATEHHNHPWEHEVFIVEGTGELLTEDGPQAFQSGSAVYVPSNAMHQFQNTGSAPLRFICVIPNSGDR